MSEETDALQALLKRLRVRGIEVRCRDEALRFGATLEETLRFRGKGEKTSGHITLARGAIFRYLNEDLWWSSVAIGKMMRIDHTTVLRGIERYKDYRAQQKKKRREEAEDEKA